MRTTGKYTAWDDETFIIQCSYDEMYDLFIGLKTIKRHEDRKILFNTRFERWYKMLEEVDDSEPGQPSFGQDYFCTNEY